ncbi:MAG: ATP-binding protein [Acidobacteriota bacterium]
MKIKFGIMIKLFFWYCALVSIFYGTIVILFVHIQQIMKTSEDVVNKNYRISSASKKMIENLLWMEENESKYDLLKKDEYRNYFMEAQKEYHANLVQVLPLGAGGRDGAASPWQELYRKYQAQFPGPSADDGQDESSKMPWVPDDVINEWIQTITKARAENELAIESQMHSLNDRGQMAVRWGFIGLGCTVLVGLLGSFFLAHWMNRPLQELRRGIRSIGEEGRLGEPIRVLSKDEFGELAGAFNDMAVRLKEEECMRSDFISMLSHEIRTPLTSIRESVNLIAEEVMGPINERQGRFLDIASREIARICDLLNHLMDVSRLEAGGFKIDPKPLDPSTFVSESIHRLTPAAEAREIRIHAEIPAEMPYVLGDHDNLQQVLLNLLGNAIKFSPPGSDIVVKVEPGRMDGRLALDFSVSDRGPGIPPEEQALVFHKYYRASGVRDQVDGVGLGLSISKYIIEAHGGQVWVKSSVGAGSTFGFTLPTDGKDMVQ